MEVTVFCKEANQQGITVTRYHPPLNHRHFVVTMSPIARRGLILILICHGGKLSMGVVLKAAHASTARPRPTWVKPVMCLCGSRRPEKGQEWVIVVMVVVSSGEGAVHFFWKNKESSNDISRFSKMFQND